MFRPGNLFSSSVNKAWSDSARQKSAEARHAHAKAESEGRAIGVGAGLGTGAGLMAGEAGGKALLMRQGEWHRDFAAAVQRGAPGPAAWRNKAAADILQRPQVTGGKTVTSLEAERVRRGAPVAHPPRSLGYRTALAARKWGPLAAAVPMAAAGGYIGHRIWQAVHKFNDTEQRDAQGRWSGLGEHIGGVAGVAAGVYNARRVGSAINRTLKKPRTVNIPSHEVRLSSKRVMHRRVGFSTPARSFTLPKMKRGGRWGMAAIGAYAAARGAGAAGSYIGSKIDDATSRVFGR